METEPWQIKLSTFFWEMRWSWGEVENPSAVDTNVDLQHLILTK